MPPHPSDDPDDLAMLARCAADLADAVDAALAGWVQRSVAGRWVEWSPAPLPPEVAMAATEAGQAAREAVVPPLRELLTTDVDEQRTNPLTLIRGAVVHPTAVLQAAGVPPVVRDDQAARLFPADVYDLTPAAFADLDPSVHEPGLVWGAAKAHVVLRRRRGGPR